MTLIGILTCTFELLHKETLLPVPVIHCVLETLYKEALLDKFTAIQAQIVTVCDNFKSFNVIVTVRTAPAETVYSCVYVAIFIKLLINLVLYVSKLWLQNEYKLSFRCRKDL